MTVAWFDALGIVLMVLFALMAVLLLAVCLWRDVAEYVRRARKWWRGGVTSVTSLKGTGATLEFNVAIRESVEWRVRRWAAIRLVGVASWLLGVGMEAGSEVDGVQR